MRPNIIVSTYARRLWRSIFVSEFGYLATSVLSSGITNLNVTTLSGEMQHGEKYAEYYLDKNSVYETVLDVYYRQVD